MGMFRSGNLKSRRLYAMLAATILISGAFAGARWYQMSVFSINPADPTVTLSDVERAVAATFGAPEIEEQKLAAVLQNGRTMLFDVREQAEFDQSHISGAIRVPPEISADEFRARFGSALKGKMVVFYCAVGVRSAMMLNRVKPAIEPEGLFNLRGGIFRWFTDGRSVVAADGPSKSVHPYDDAWGSLLARTVTRKSALE